MEIMVFKSHGLEQVTPQDPVAFLRDTEEVVWINIKEPASDQLDLIQEVYGFHPLAIEDTRNHQQRPKVEEYSDHLFIIVNQIEMQTHDVAFHELDIFLGRRYIVTTHTQCESAIQDTLRRIHRIETFKHVSSEYLLYMLLDTVVDEFLPILEKIDDEIEQMSESMLLNPTRDKLERIFKLRRILNEVWRVVGQQLNMFNILTRHQEDLLTTHDVLSYYLRDVQDHLIRLSDMTTTFREHLSNLLDLYISANGNRLNIVVHRLTIITIVIGVLTVVSGFFGMNFERMFPPMSARWGLSFAVSLMIFLPMFILFIFRRLKWY